MLGENLNSLIRIIESADSVGFELYQDANKILDLFRIIFYRFKNKLFRGCDTERETGHVCNVEQETGNRKRES